MLVVPLPAPVPTRGPTSHPVNTLSMSKPETESEPALLWVNKDASNLHSKKHVAEVNAHVQKRGSRGQAARIRKATQSSSRDSKSRRRSSESPSISSRTSSPRQPFSHAQRELLLELATPPPQDHVESALYPVLEHRSKSPEDPSLYDSTSLCIISQLAHAEDHFSGRIPYDFDTSMPLPHLISGLSSHDQSLVRTCMEKQHLHLSLTNLYTDMSYVPDSLFGPTNSNIYCPIRYASIANMSQDPLGLLWVLIALDMFLAKIRGDIDHTALILQRKDEAYRMMTSRLNNPRDSQSLGFIIGTGSAATAELFFGDSSTALMHLGAIDTVIQTQGGNSTIARLPLAVSIPLLTAFAYRSLLQDNFLSPSSFNIGRTQFLGTLRSILLQDQEARYSLPPTHDPLFLSPEDLAFHNASKPSGDLYQLQQTKQRLFAPGSVIRKFIEPNFACNKPSDSVDHFLVLYNINVALHDFCSSGNISGAIRFLEDLVADVNVAHASSSSDSGLKMSGVRCLFISQHAQSFGRGASEGIARAWQAVDGLEILKFLSPTSRNNVYQTLSAILTSTESGIMTIEELDSIDMESSANWWTGTGLSELSATQVTESSALR